MSMTAKERLKTWQDSFASSDELSDEATAALLEAFRTHANAVLAKAIAAVCINCKRGVAAEATKSAPEGRWVHFVNDGLQARGAPGRYVGCTAAPIRALPEEK